MNNNEVSYIKTDNNKIINENSIKWIQKINNCLEVCTKSTGCTAGNDTHKICNYHSVKSYEKFDKFFK